MNRRVTLTLIPKATAALDRLQVLLGIGQADAVNRSIQLCAFLEEELAIGKHLVLRDPETGEQERVKWL